MGQSRHEFVDESQVGTITSLLRTVHSDSSRVSEHQSWIQLARREIPGADALWRGSGTSLQGLDVVGQPGGLLPLFPRKP